MTRLKPNRIPIVLSLALAISVPATSAAEESPPPGYKIHRSIPPPGAKTHVVIPGERFRAGGFKRWLYGSDYRDLWTTPIEVAVLDLDRIGGAGQSISLHFTGQDGRRYTVRSLDKDPMKRKWDELKNTVVDDVLQDMISALLPTGVLVVDPLLEATGILYTKHTLVVIPDDQRLGEYRKDFAGLIGMLQEHPSEGPDDTPGFAGSRKIIRLLIYYGGRHPAYYCGVPRIVGFRRHIPRRVEKQFWRAAGRNIRLDHCLSRKIGPSL